MRFRDPKLPRRFWDKVKPDPRTGCWVWRAAKDSKGYGQFWHAGRKRKAHHMTKPVKQTTHHTCFNTSCVNPKHLRDLSRERNSQIGGKKP